MSTKKLNWIRSVFGLCTYSVNKPSRENPFLEKNELEFDLVLTVALDLFSSAKIENFREPNKKAVEMHLSLLQSFSGQILFFYFVQQNITTINVHKRLLVESGLMDHQWCSIRPDSKATEPRLF